MGIEPVGQHNAVMGRAATSGLGGRIPYRQFFAVAVELFFKRPDLMKNHNPELYAALENYFIASPHRGE